MGLGHFLKICPTKCKIKSSNVFGDPHMIKAQNSPVITLYKNSWSLSKMSIGSKIRHALDLGQHKHSYLTLYHQLQA